MTTTAENLETPEAPGAAPEQAPQIPKWRLDEAIAKLRAREEELNVKNQLLDQMAQRNAPQGSNGPTAEELGIEPQTLNAVHKLASHLVEKRLAQAEGPIRGALANMANKVEETEFLLTHGKDKGKYLEKIKAQRQKHFAMTQGYQSVDDAYKIVMFDELMNATVKKTAPQAAPQVTQAANSAVEDVAPAVPDAQQTRTGTPAGTAKGFGELTIAEQEAILERQVQQMGGI